MLHQALLSNASFDAENSEYQLLFVPISQTALLVGDVFFREFRSREPFKICSDFG